uniref:Uncharacterized protein n=1 Tax=Rhizophora mucronata TaxID=61149 RepID=A0A2P2QX47_RHIMU
MNLKVVCFCARYIINLSCSFDSKAWPYVMINFLCWRMMRI